MRLALFLALAGLAGCQKSGQESPVESGGEGAREGAPGTPKPTDADLDAPLARIDDVVITVREFQEQINRQSPYVRARYTSMERKKEFLENLVRFEVLAKEAQARGFHEHPDVVRTMKQVMIQKLMKAEFENRIKPEDISEEAMRNHYQQNLAEYHKPEEVRVSAIILRKKKVADEVAALARGERGASNKGFRELVAQYSTDEETKLHGGDLRYFSRDTREIPRPVVEAAFAIARTGEVVGPIAAGDRFYILKQTGRRKSLTKSFEEVKRQIQNRLYRDRRTEAQQKFVDELRSRAKIQVYEGNLKRIRIDRSKAEAPAGARENLPAALPE